VGERDNMKILDSGSLLVPDYNRYWGDINTKYLLKFMKRWNSRFPGNGTMTLSRTLQQNCPSAPLRELFARNFSYFLTPRRKGRRTQRKSEVICGLPLVKKRYADKILLVEASFTLHISRNGAYY